MKASASEAYYTGGFAVPLLYKVQLGGIGGGAVVPRGWKGERKNKEGRKTREKTFTHLVIIFDDDAGV